METAALITVTSSLTIGAGAFFAVTWVRGVNAALKTLDEKKLSKTEFDQYKEYVKELGKERTDAIANLWAKVGQAHSHTVLCSNPECHMAEAKEVKL